MSLHKDTELKIKRQLFSAIIYEYVLEGIKATLRNPA
jgi:hypothetical protein